MSIRTSDEDRGRFCPQILIGVADPHRAPPIAGRVQIDAPLGVRAVVDGARGEPVPVERPG